MSETFACPQCGKSYSHAGRKPGKAVVCVCGHRFLVPAPEVRAPRVELPLHPPSEPRRESAPAPRPERSPSPSLSPASRTPPPAAPRVSRPAPQRPAPPQELEAEVVYPGHLQALPAAYAPTSAPLTHPAYEPLAPPPAALRTTRSSIESSQRFGMWLGRAVLFAIVPLAMLCVVIGHLQMRRTGGLIRNSWKAAPVLRRPASQAAGNLLTITAASMRSAGGAVEFHAQFTRGGFAPQAGQQYLWIISAKPGTVEIPISSAMLTQQTALSGTARGAVAQRFRSPCTMWIESQPPDSGSRQRVSNQFQF